MDKENLENECVIEIKNLRKDYKMYKTKKQDCWKLFYHFIKIMVHLVQLMI